MRFLQEVLLNGDVVGLEKQDATRGFAVAACASCLLHVGLGRTRHLVVDDVANVGLVHAQAKSVGRDHDHLAAGRHERRLRLFTLFRGHLAVVAFDRNLAVAQGHVEIVDRAHGSAVHNARPPQALDEFAQHAQLVGFASHLAHVEGQVGTMEGNPADIRVLHAQLNQHVFGNGWRGRCRQTENRRPAKHLGGAAKPQVGRSEVVAPL